MLLQQSTCSWKKPELEGPACSSYILNTYFTRVLLIPQAIFGSIEDGLKQIVEAMTPRGLGGHGPRKVKVN